MKFKIGQHVAYVGITSPREDAWCAVHQLLIPEHGKRYTIRGYRIDNGPAYVLEEIVNRKILHRSGVMAEPHFIEKVFRPLTDISIFTEMLKTKEVEPVA